MAICSICVLFAEPFGGVCSIERVGVADDKSFFCYFNAFELFGGEEITWTMEVRLIATKKSYLLTIFNVSNAKSAHC